MTGGRGEESRRKGSRSTAPFQNSRAAKSRSTEHSVNPASNATLVPNSVLCGAMNMPHIRPTKGYRPRSGYAMPGAGHDSEPSGQRQPEACEQAEHPHSMADPQTTDHDEDVGQHSAHAGAAPPEAERIDPTPPEDDECADETDIGGIENLEASPSDDVLGGQREGRYRCENLEVVERPVRSRFRTRHPQDERHAATRQHGAGWPHESSLTSEDHHDLYDETRTDGGQDLGHRHPKPERHLTQHVDRHHDRGDVQPYITWIWQHQRIRPTADRDRARRKSDHRRSIIYINYSCHLRGRHRCRLPMHSRSVASTSITTADHRVAAWRVPVSTRQRGSSSVVTHIDPNPTASDGVLEPAAVATVPATRPSRRADGFQMAAGCRMQRRSAG